MRKLLVIAAVTAALLGCSQTPTKRHQALEVEEEEQIFPRRGASLLETLNGLYPARSGDFRVLVHKLEVLRTDVSPWELVDVDDARAGRVVAKDRSFAVIVHRTCRAAVDKRAWGGTTTNWFILNKNRLAAFDYQDFTYQCLQFNVFRPARAESIEIEREVFRRMAAKFPDSSLLSIDVYRKGVELAKVGRVEDAELALVNGDTRFDQTAFNRADKKQGSKGRSAKRSDKNVARTLLERAIQEAKYARLNPQIDSAPTDDSFDEDPVDELERLRRGSAARDQERRELWERERQTRRFVQTKGGWQVVDDQHRRRGRAEGEIWVTFEEMQLIKEEQKQQVVAERQPQAKREPVAAAPPPPQPERPPLFVEVEGQWAPVSERQRARGPQNGETWITWSEVQAAQIAQQLGSAERQQATQPVPPEQGSPAHLQLVTEVDGKWRFVTQQERSAGPADGELWLTLAEMREAMAQRAARQQPQPLAP